MSENSTSRSGVTSTEPALTDPRAVGGGEGMADPEFSSKSPAFQFYPKDYLSDAKTRAMTFKQRGMYWDLVSHCWLEGALPADPKEIARILGITTPARFAAHDWPVLGRCFRLVGEHHEHPRLEIERRKQNEHREEKAAAGRLGAARRWTDKSMAQPSPPHGTPIGLPMAKNASSSASSSAISKLQKERVHTPAVPPDLGRRSGAFVHWYQDKHQELIGGYIGNANRDDEVSLALCQQFSDQELRDAALVWFGMDDSFATRGNRTIPKFASRITECVEKARKVSA